MAGLKEIRRRITSVKNTKQITRAMKLVSAAKLRRAQDAAVFGRAYVKQLARTLEKIASELPEGFSHPLLGSGEEVARRRVVVVAGERGLCGAYNSTVLKTVMLKEGRATDGLQRDFVCIGRRAVSFAKRQGWDIAGVFEGMPEEAARLPVAEIVESVVRDFLKGDIDEVVVYFTEFRSAMSQEVRCIPLLPFAADSKGTDETAAAG
ncbi:MAG: F0F1 ATP synthase subunit gamma, partial [bacterium]|nr:F0F1 ATP synthase subunit gamma [bacterium]